MSTRVEMAAVNGSDCEYRQSSSASRHSLLSAVLAGLLAAMPVWMTTYPPMVDLPQYAAQVAMLNNLMEGNWAFADLFGVELFTPYLSAFFLIWVMEPVTGMLAAVKLVVSLALFGMPVSTALLVREFRGDPNWSWLVVPASYSFAFNWGFLNFLVAAPLGMLFLVAASRYAREPSLRFGLGMAVLTHLLFFSHVLPLFFFGALAGILILTRASSLPRAFLALLPLLSLAPTGLGWGLPSLDGAQVQWPILWDLRWSRVLDIPTLTLGTDKTVSHGLLFVSLLAIPFLGGARLTHDLYRYVPLGLCLLVLMLVPNLLAGTYFTYHRFAIFLVPLYLLIVDRTSAVDSSRRRKLAKFGVVAVAVAWSGMTALRFKAYEREGADFRAIIRQMEPDHRVLSMVFHRHSQFTVAPVYLHYPVWYQAENLGLVDFNFSAFLGYPIHYLPDHIPVADGNFVWQPYSFEWPQHRGYGYRYLLARAGAGRHDAPLPAGDCDEFALVSKVGTWWLYEVKRQRSLPESCGSPDS